MDTERKYLIEFIPTSWLSELDALTFNLLWIHIEGEHDEKSIEELAKTLRYDSGLKCIFMSGHLCQHLHDCLDDELIKNEHSQVHVLTAWYDEGFEEAAWDFYNLFVDDIGVRKAKALIATTSNSNQLELMEKLSISIRENA